MPVQENSLKPYSEVVTGSIIYGTIGVFLDRIQDMSVGSVLFSRLFFGFCMIFYLPAAQSRAWTTEARKEEKISSAAGPFECDYRHVLFLIYQV